MKKVVFILIFCSLIVSSFSQNASKSDSVEALEQDSALLKTHLQGKQILETADSAIRMDSAFEVKLQDELNQVKSWDVKRREKLQMQIDSTKQSQEDRKERVKQQVDSIRQNTVGVPVIFKEDTLFYIYAKLGPFSPSERANTIEQKISKITNDGFSPDFLKIFHGEETSDLFYNEVILLSITDRDGFWANTDRSALAEEYKTLIATKIASYLDDNSLVRTLLRVGMIILVIVVFFFMIRYLNKGFSRMVAYVLKKFEKYLNGVKIRNYEFLTKDREVQVIMFMMNVFKWILIVFIVYTALPVIFSIFPATEGIARKLISYVLDPLRSIIMSLIGYIPELITITIIALVTRYFVKFLKYLSYEIENGKLQISGFYPDWARPTFNLVSFLTHAFAFIVIFPYLPGSNSPVFQGVSVFLGLLISLGSSSAISNMIAGLVITYMRPFKIGERVKIGDTVGDVIEKTMLVTRVRTIKNEDVTIPNASILNGQTINYSTSAASMGLILNTTITIGYDIYWQKVRDCMVQAALKTEHILDDPKPFVLQTSLDDFYVSYQINAYTHEAAKAAKIYSELHSNILDVLHAAGIEIMSPHFRAERDGSMVNIPEENQVKK